jgi:uncharacterized membrane protein YqjE
MGLGMSDDDRRVGLFASLRKGAATALELVQVRLELLGTELELEKRKLFDGICLAAVAMIFLSVGLGSLCIFIVLLFWDGYRLAAMASVSALCLGLGMVLLQQSRTRLKSPSGIFNASTSELQKDQNSVQP